MVLLYLSLLGSVLVMLLLGLLLSSSCGSPWVLPTLLFSRLLFMNFLCTLSSAHLGYIHLVSDRFLFNTPDLKISNDNGHAHRTSFSGHAQSIPTNRHVHRTIRHTWHAQTSEQAHRTS